MIRLKTPEIINIPAGKLDDIKSRFAAGAILEEDKKIILLVLSTYSWLYRQLQAKKLGIQRLRNLFGFSTEKRSALKKKNNVIIPPDVTDANDVNGTSGGNVTSIKKHLNGTRRQIMAD